MKIIRPWESPVNYAPYNLATLKNELVRRLGIAGLKQLGAVLLELPGIWPLVRRLLDRLDNRPGRLYSFVATRP